MTHEVAIKPMDSAIWEMSEAFAGLEDKELWVRPHSRLLSIGELATHVAFGEARWLLPSLESPLNNDKIDYYPRAIVHPFTLEMTAKELYDEVKSVHEICKAHILKTLPDLAEKHPEREDWTWGYTLEYMAFHIAYHTGQMYSVRHILGHETADN